MQFYHVNLHSCAGLDPRDAAILCAQLPRDGRVFCVLDPDNAYGYQLEYLRHIEYYTHVLAWQQTKDGLKGRNAPEPAKLPSEVKRDAEARDPATRAWVDEILGIRGGEE